MAEDTQASIRIDAPAVMQREIRLIGGLFDDLFALYANEAPADEIADLRRTLVRYFRHHIQHQDNLMAASHYPAQPPHAAHHERFLRALDYLQQAYEGPGLEARHLRVLRHRFFSTHVPVLDRNLDQWLRARIDDRPMAR